MCYKGIELDAIGLLEVPIPSFPSLLFGVPFAAFKLLRTSLICSLDV
jgi:hypothetical protein